MEFNIKTLNSKVVTEILSNNIKNKNNYDLELLNENIKRSILLGKNAFLIKNKDGHNLEVNIVNNFINALEIVIIGIDSFEIYYKEIENEINYDQFIKMIKNGDVEFKDIGRVQLLEYLYNNHSNELKEYSEVSRNKAIKINSRVGIITDKVTESFCILLHTREFYEEISENDTDGFSELIDSFNNDFINDELTLKLFGNNSIIRYPSQYPYNHLAGTISMDNCDLVDPILYNVNIHDSKAYETINLKFEIIHNLFV